MSSTRALSCLLLFAGLAVASGCSTQRQAADPEVVRVTVLPDDAPEALRERYVPLVSYLEETLKRRFALVIPRSYEEFQKDTEAGRYDLVYFGGYTFVREHQRHGYLPVAMRDVDTRFVSYFIVRKDDPARTIEDLRGRKLSFGDRLSTSGHLMPRHFLKEKGIEPEAFFAEVHYSGSHDRTAEAVLSGVADVGAANSQVIDRMVRSGGIPPDSLRILWRTPPYPDYVFAVRGLSESLRGQLLEAFLGLSVADARQREILELQGARFFLPADAHDFLPLQQIAEAMGLLGGQP